MNKVVIQIATVKPGSRTLSGISLSVYCQILDPNNPTIATATATILAGLGPIPKNAAIGKGGAPVTLICDRRCADDGAGLDRSGA